MSYEKTETHYDEECAFYAVSCDEFFRKSNYAN